jgi:hypothetical protein
MVSLFCICIKESRVVAHYLIKLYIIFPLLFIIEKVSKRQRKENEEKRGNSIIIVPEQYV